MEGSKAMAGSPDAVFAIHSAPERTRAASRRLAHGFRLSKTMRENCNV
jgi:hypothetical protein